MGSTNFVGRCGHRIHHLLYWVLWTRIADELLADIPAWRTPSNRHQATVRGCVSHVALLKSACRRIGTDDTPNKMLFVLFTREFPVQIADRLRYTVDSPGEFRCVAARAKR